jgi:REP element-mobilizing transposase RayT
MPRTARASAGGYGFHVLNRGNARAEVFHHSGDTEAFLDTLTEASVRRPMRLLGYCLMPNHFHFVLWPQSDGDLSRGMHRLMTAHVRRDLKCYHSSGHVWPERFKAFPIQEDEQLLIGDSSPIPTRFDGPPQGVGKPIALSQEPTRRGFYAATGSAWVSRPRRLGDRRSPAPRVGRGPAATCGRQDGGVGDPRRTGSSGAGGDRREVSLIVLRYVERNPLRAGLVDRAEAWPWSSLGRRGLAALVYDGPVPRGAEWVAGVNAPRFEAECAPIRNCIARGAPLGTASWTEATAARPGLEASLRPPSRPRRGGDPSEAEADQPRSRSRSLVGAVAVQDRGS